MNQYYPRTATDASEFQMLKSWGEDYGLTTHEILNLSAKERADAFSALHSLTVWWKQPTGTDYGNPFWMEDEGFRDAEDDTKTLAAIANQVFDRRPPIPEDTWRYFDQFPEGSDPRKYKLVHVDRLIQTKPSRSEPGNPPSVIKAYAHMDALARGEKDAKKRAPLGVRDNGDGTYSVIDGNATTAVAKMQGWKQMPVHIIQDQKTNATSDLKYRQ